MGTVPPTPNFTAGEFPTAAKLNQLQTLLNFLTNPPRAQANVAAAQSHTATGAYQTLALDAETVDTDGMHDLVTNNSRLTVQTPGKYLVWGQVTYAANAAGRRAARVALTGVGTGQVEVMVVTTAAATTGCPIPPLEFTAIAGDYFELQGFQSSGGNLAYTVGQSTFLRAQWIGI